MIKFYLKHHQGGGKVALGFGPGRIRTGPDPDFGHVGGGITQHEGTGHQLIKSEKMQ